MREGKQTGASMQRAIWVGLVLLLACGPVGAWNLHGHMLVSAYAWEKLTPAAKARAAALLRLNPDYQSWIELPGVTPSNRDQVAFTRAAGWADDIKGDPAYTDQNDSISGQNASRNIGYADKLRHRYWHYKDIPFSSDGTPVSQPEAPNAETQINAFGDALRSPASDDVKSYDLVWLLHLVGDVHQPLHATARFTRASPRGDRGGNDVKLCEAPCRKNLHSFWDDLLGTGKSPVRAIEAARRLPDPPAGAASAQNVPMWIEASFKLAKDRVYVRPIGPGSGPYRITNRYDREAGHTAEEQVVVAGARLAELLNGALGTP